MVGKSLLRMIVSLRKTHVISACIEIGTIGKIAVHHAASYMVADCSKVVILYSNSHDTQVSIHHRYWYHVVRIRRVSDGQRFASYHARSEGCQVPHPLCSQDGALFRSMVAHDRRFHHQVRKVPHVPIPLTYGEMQCT